LKEASNNCRLAKNKINYFFAKVLFYIADKMFEWILFICTKHGVVFMVISAYQVNNVLRVYHDQLRNSRASSKAVKNPTQSPDSVTISSTAKQKAVSEKIATSIANKINGYSTKDEIGNKLLKKYEANSEIQSKVSQNISEDLLFKMIDEEGETIKMLNVDDIKQIGN